MSNACVCVCVCVCTARQLLKPWETIITVPAVVGGGRVTDGEQCYSFMYMLMIYTGWGAARHFKCIFYHILKKHSAAAPKHAELFPRHTGILNSQFSGGICWYFLKTYNLGGQANCTYELFKLCIIDCSQVGMTKQTNK